jgi:hypothetical protein
VKPNDPNVVMLDIVAQRLGEALCQQLVFAGGAVAGLLITDPAQPAIRPTEDFDLLALADVLGFSNRWHPLAAESAWNATLPSGQAIRVITAAAFIGTKLEAFVGRGHGDYLFSHDLGDIISIVDGRKTLIEELAAADAELRTHVGRAFTEHLRKRAFRDSLPGHLPGDEASQARLPGLVGKLERIAALAG